MFSGIVQVFLDFWAYMCYNVYLSTFEVLLETHVTISILHITLNCKCSNQLCTEYYVLRQFQCCLMTEVDSTFSLNTPPHVHVVVHF